LLKAIDRGWRSNKCHGSLVDEEIFSKIFSGAVFPGVISCLGDGDWYHWWDDFLDVTNKYPIAENYTRWYGEEFVSAQQIALGFIKANAL
jgi:hypothetical protein